ncbi:NAD(P)-dependent alcohol dehydrogenase [Limnoraphis robusta Tam1]|uniref:alcohol dehydrogenase (NADP(+)) n=1 Tax=Limnoraphis robusta CS-951 TaxID=1637645 RepID=A0A0F5YGY9_9CYAN|nr:NAD(P)-dependent alcohol dehydrogenase [Limnoraphis robusta]KKD37922.1 alcohol dehydrogenase [Limnoraphis robusta CS-951]MEA5541077.1 NAD(P)-dependent alcohol dehydrogenase [Limnoraphis robusta Tam1]
MKIQGLAAKTKGSQLEAYSYESPSPENFQCLIKVLACGICHSDIHMIDNDWGISNYPIIPGHEVIGEVVEIGSQVHHIKVGDRVGVGWQRTACLSCRDCLRGNENLCNDIQALIATGPGGFADYLEMDSRFAFPIPDGIKTNVAGPLLCGGITVYSALRYAGMGSGLEIGIIGVGGLGHLAVQFASKLGNSVTVFTTSQDKAEFAHELGAKETVIVEKNQAPSAPSQPFNILLSTVPVSIDWESYVNFLDSDGTLTIVGVPDAPLTLPLFPLIMKRRRILGSPIGGRAMMQEMLSVADRYHIEPQVEIFPMEKAQEALEKVRNNQVRYRAVLSHQV